MNNETRANVNNHIYQLERQLEGLLWYAENCNNREEAQAIIARAHEIELLIGY